MELTRDRVAVGLALSIWIGGCGPSPKPSPPPPAPPVPVSVLTEEEQGRVTRALASGRLELPAHMDVLRGNPGALPGAAPVGTAVVEPRPQFSWTAVAGATRYSVRILDERFREVAKSGSLKSPTWTPSRDLPRGRVLEWKITASSKGGTVIRPDPPQPEARFVVLDASTVATIVTQRARLSAEPIALGLMLAKVGLFAEAEAVLERALTDARYDPTQVRALLTRLRAR